MATAPMGGATTPARPTIAWFRPPTRDRCFSGTIIEVAAAMAGQWNAEPDARTARTARTCQTSTIPRANRTASTTVAPAMSESDAIITLRLCHLSTNVPAMGPSTICGA